MKLCLWHKCIHTLEVQNTKLCIIPGKYAGIWLIESCILHKKQQYTLLYQTKLTHFSSKQK